MSGDESFAILQELIVAQKAGDPVVLATIVKARGSVPRHVGTKMLVYADGRMSGTIGGGEMEARVIDMAQTVLAADEAQTLPYALIDPKRGDPGVCGGEVEIFMEPYLPPATVYVIGCGHVGRAVAHLAHWLGYRTVVTDDRVALASAENIPNAHVYLPGPINDALAKHPIHSNTFVVVVTRNVMVDREILPQLVKTPTPFIGVMGSRRRWETTRGLLLQDGVLEADLSRFHSPLGLELNAESPEEIAVSILSEIIMLRRKGTGERMAKGKGEK
ncbi:MAG: XdhC family protein [Candidatus Promineifilaceae bacterium]